MILGSVFAVAFFISVAPAIGSGSRNDSAYRPRFVNNRTILRQIILALGGFSAGCHRIALVGRIGAGESTIFRG